MKSVARGRNTFQVEVTNVSPHGLWILIGDQELFVPFKEFPWFRDASIAEIADVEMPSADHLYWPTLDVDLSVESLRHPERYPLVSRATRGQGRTAKRPHSLTRSRAKRVGR